MKSAKGLKLLFTAIFMLCTVGVLSAEPITITWEWEAADEEVSGFRYQLNAEDPDGWTVVDVSVTEYTLGPVEDTLYHVLYVQQTYDNEHWSESGVLAYDPVEFGAVVPETVAEPEPEPEPVPEPEPEVVGEAVAEQPMEDVVVETVPLGTEPEPIDDSFFDDFVVADGGEDAIEDIEPWDDLVEPEPVQTAVASSATAPEMRIDVHVGAGGKADNLIMTGVFDPDSEFNDLRTRILPSISLDFVHIGRKSEERAFDLGYKLGLGYNGYQIEKDGADVPGISLHGMMVLSYPMGERFVFEGSGGLSFMFTSSNIHPPTKNQLGFFFGPQLQIQGRYLVHERWSISLQAETRALLGGTFKAYELTGIVRLGVGYQF